MPNTIKIEIPNNTTANEVFIAMNIHNATIPTIINIEHIVKNVL